MLFRSLREREREREEEPTRARPLEVAAVSAPTPATKAKSKLSYREERELAGLPGEIEALEREQKALTESLSAPDYPHADAARVSADGARLMALEETLLAKLERWEHLESEAQRLKGR